MRYQIRVAGKVFEGTDHRSLLKRAVEAKKEALRTTGNSLPYHRLVKPAASTAAAGA